MFKKLLLTVGLVLLGTSSVSADLKDDAQANISFLEYSISDLEDTFTSTKAASDDIYSNYTYLNTKNEDYYSANKIDYTLYSSNKTILDGVYKTYTDVVQHNLSEMDDEINNTNDFYLKAKDYFDYTDYQDSYDASDWAITLSDTAWELSGYAQDGCNSMNDDLYKVNLK